LKRSHLKTTRATMTKARAKNEKARTIVSWSALRRARVRLLRIVLRQNTKEPHRALKRLERGSANATLWIFVGIVVETGGVIWFARNWAESLVAIVGNALIGYGLVLEYVLILRAIVASGAIEREARLKVAEANARGLEARQTAEEARRETEQLRSKHAWRRINLNQWNTLVIRLRSAPSTVDIWYPAGDPEVQNFAGWLGGTLARAGWSVEIMGGTYGLLGMDMGLMLPPSGTDPRITSIAEALQAADIEYRHGALPAHPATFVTDAGKIARTVNDPAPVELFVGPNPK
jgi:hypothetical protein